MKCPHCEYESNWDVKGDLGEFYDLSNEVKMTRHVTRHWENDTKSVYGCPSCGTLFMDVS